MFFQSLQKHWLRFRETSIASVRGRGGEWWLASVAFAESSFFPLPPDILLMAVVLTGARRLFYYVMLTTGASVAGGFLGYLIGWLLFDYLGQPIVTFYHLGEQLAVVGRLFTDNAFIAIFAAAFTPIPYKVFTISAGLFRIDLVVFFVASLIGRGLRFLAVGYLTALMGRRFVGVLYRYFNWLTLLAVLLVILFLFYFL